MSTTSRGRAIELALACALCACEQAPQGPTELHAAVVSNGNFLGVTNLDNFAWAGCTLELNPSEAGPGYTRDISGLASHATQTLAIWEFSKEDGLRFDPSTHTAKYLHISCFRPAPHENEILSAFATIDSAQQ